MLALISLFFAAFFSATVLPGFSEVYMVGLYTSGEHLAVTLVLVATAGNVCGSLVNWFLGKYLLHFKDRKWFPANDEQLEKATNWYKKYGIWSLLLAWLPIVGDALTLAAGVLKANIWAFLVLVTIGKSVRYIVVMSAASAFI